MSIKRTTPDDKGQYQITFRQIPFTNDNVWAEAIRNSLEYREMMHRHYVEQTQLINAQHEERTRFVDRRQRDMREAAQK